MITIKILETPEEMTEIEDLQRIVWPDSETDIIPAHVLVTLAHNGGMVLGAYQAEKLVGLSIGFPGLYFTADGPRPKHCSHELGTHPDYINLGIGFALKRAQWQFVRNQGLDRITWTFDPLLSRNAHLNIARLGAVCNTYLRNIYGDMRDGLNAGLPSDRFQVDWWVNSRRVEGCLSSNPRPRLTLADYEAADIQNLYPVEYHAGLVAPAGNFQIPTGNLALAEIPDDFMTLKSRELKLGLEWRHYSRELFEKAFEAGYIVTDFVYEKTGDHPRSFYVLTNGEATF